MILDKVKEMLGLDQVPEDVSEYYSRAEDLEEALHFIRNARYRDEQRRSRAMEDLKLLQGREDELIEEGKDVDNETRKVILAGRIREIRERKDEIKHKMNKIYNKRIKIYAEHMKSLETLVAMNNEALPSKEHLQESAVRAREELDKLDETYSMAEGVDLSDMPEIEVTEEEREIIREFEEDEPENEDVSSDVSTETGVETDEPKEETESIESDPFEDLDESRSTDETTEHEQQIFE